MAGEQVKRRKDHRNKGDTRDSRSHKERPHDGGTTSNSVPATDHPADVDALRKARLAYLAKSPEERQKEMKYDYVKRTRTVSQVGEEKERRHRTTQEHKPERKDLKSSRTTRTRTREHKSRPSQRDDSEDGYVYKRVERESVPDKAQPQSSKHKGKTTESTSRKVDAKRQVPEPRQTEPARRQEAQGEHEQG